MRKNEPYESKKRIQGSWILPLIIVILILLLRHFMFTPVVVEGSSMMSTLQDGDRMVANKIGYKLNGLERFDISVFKHKDGTNYIKRIIGLPGDYIEYKNDQLYINGKKYSEAYLESQKKDLEREELLTDDFNIKTLPSTLSPIVPEGHYFVLGDNRRGSKDSRDIGFIPANNIIGKTNVVYWPLNEMKIVK
ncbi:signal peptidase I [Bacillus cereus]|uniref:Signal peptidase I n=2 Tax=Bacillus cereus group TaxID=86661 RepID=A0A9W5KC98_BACC8|nr:MULTISPECIES: signal peptidase I [Bacillus cereus group]AMR01278.1 S26 family signal peptidase [Bacillus thuringiensis]AYF81116.1 signal peptidase I [Bacillus thuringiensis]EJR25749.1 signal peptidase I [Bacillus cereus VD014]EJR75742.1 signal peptidase I [Bacillus cereus VD156]MBJ8153829.1 signal peptidase I [Bacillus cereus]